VEVIDACRNALAPRGMCRCRQGWTALSHERPIPDFPWEKSGPYKRPPPDRFTPAMWRLLHPPAAYPTLMDLMALELQGEPLSAAP
jgi:hypothetical protein